MAKQINIRMDTATYEKLEYLLKMYESKTKIVAVAIDRLYMEHKEGDNANKETEPTVRTASH
jgi:hypothetical protein